MPRSANPTKLEITKLDPLPVSKSQFALPPIGKGSTASRRLALPSADLVPLFYAALLFLAGIVLARFVYLRPGLLLAGLLPLTIATIIAIWKTPRLTWPAIAAIWIVLGAWSTEMERQPAPSPSLLTLSDGLLRTVEGTVAVAGPLQEETVLAAANEEDEEDEEDESDKNSQTSQQKEQMQQVDLQVSAAEVVTDTSDAMTALPQADIPRIRLLVRWPNGQPTLLQCGERLRLIVRFQPPDVFHDAGVWNRTTFLQEQQVTATGSIIATQKDEAQPRLTRLSPTRSALQSAACQLNSWRNAASASLQSLPAFTRKLPRPLRASPEDAAMLTALLVGDRTYLTRPLRAGFERTGSFHLIVVSGLHLAILAGCVLGLCRRLRLPRLPATLVTIAATLAYALFTGFAIPAQRSFWMISLYLIGRLLFRDRSPLNVIGFATLCLLAVSPRSIFDASLQMTVLSVAAIAGIAIPLLERTLQARVRATRDLSQISLDAKLPPTIAQFRVTLRLLVRYLERATNHWLAWKLLPLLVRYALRLGEVIFITLVVELALALPMAMFFHRITVYALPVNLLILPLLGLLVPLAMVTLLTLAFLPAVATAPAALCVAVLHLSLAIVRMLGGLSFGDLRVPDPSAVHIGLAVLVFIAGVLLARTTNPVRRVAFVAVLAMAGLALWPRAMLHPEHALLFQAIDVGQGDSLLLITPDGKTLLIDAGGTGFPTRHGAQKQNTRPDTAFDIGEEVVSAALWSRGIRRLDAVALTHAHQDHMGGMSAILRNFHPSELWVGNNPPVAAYQALLQQAAAVGVRIRPLHAGDAVTLGAVSLRVLAPQASYRPGPEPKNDDSLVLQARYGATSILLEGDAESPEEHAILNEAGLESGQVSGQLSGQDLGLRSTVLKVGHHGSLTSTRPEFLAAVRPTWAIVSCGRRNRFGHPRPEILAELQAAHTRTFRTDITGTTCLLLDGQSVTAQPMCKTQQDGAR